VVHPGAQSTHRASATTTPGLAIHAHAAGRSDTMTRASLPDG
jgi:hypothetical protein